MATKKSTASTKKQTTKRTKKPLTNRLKSYNFLLVFAVLLGMLAGVFMVKVFYKGELVNTAPYVSLGSLEYDFSDGKAVKRSTPTTDSLRTFLAEKAAKDCTVVQSDLEPSQYQVIAATADVSQVLLGYGCGDTSARMFAVRDGDSWRFISPTNHFEMLYGLPECSYVKENAISKEVAPVCYSTKGDTMQYKVR